jgi:hypothetical protein
MGRLSGLSLCCALEPVPFHHRRTPGAGHHVPDLQTDPTLKNARCDKALQMAPVQNIR